ncbi:MAG TPA: hypothetical protein VN372_15755 [Methanospirillum sp.]|nr:hypothetical protein [Methanospirillum sp.]
MAGDTIFLSGTTTFNTDNQILVELYPASFGPAKKYEPSMNGGGSAIIPVIAGLDDRFGWSLNMSTAGWIPDQYMVSIEVIGKDYREDGILILTGNSNSGGANISSIPTGDEGAATLIHQENPGMAIQSFESKTGLNSSEVEKSDSEEIHKNVSTMTSEPIPTQTQKSPLSFITLLVALCLFSFTIMTRRS